MIMIVAMLAMLYFFMIRPENKRKKGSAEYAGFSDRG